MSNKRILLKVSGAFLKGKDSCFSLELFKRLASQVKKLKEKYDIAVVVGGGNIWRGKEGENFNLDREKADLLGMTSTVYNGYLLSSCLANIGVDSVVYSKINIKGLTRKYSKGSCKKDLDNGKVVIIGGGTGKTLCSTDTAAAVACEELGIDMIYAGKNGVNGVYDSDPNVNKLAKKFDKISYKDYLDNGLNVMDAQAIEICQKNKIKILVFDINQLDNIGKEIIGTIIEE